MEQVVPGSRLEGVIEPVCPTAQRGLVPRLSGFERLIQRVEQGAHSQVGRAGMECARACCASGTRLDPRLRGDDGRRRE